MSGDVKNKKIKLTFHLLSLKNIQEKLNNLATKVLKVNVKNCSFYLYFRNVHNYTFLQEI